MPSLVNTAYLIATLLVALSLVIFPFVIHFGDRIMVVTSDSMLPTLKPNDMIAVKPSSIEEIKVGDMVAFNAHFGDIDVIAHRVVEIIDEHGEVGLKTKGDNIDSVDQWIVRDQDLIGRIVSVTPNIGILLVDPVRYSIIAFVVILSLSLLWELSSKHKVPEKRKS